jgi:hypothetical protein
MEHNSKHTKKIELNVLNCFFGHSAHIGNMFSVLSTVF